MSAQLTAAAYDSFIGVIDDALALSKSALELVESAATEPAQRQAAPEVILTKVASHVYEKTASALIRTGVFEDITTAEMAQTLADAGESGQLAILEKLASRAAFPLTINLGRNGELVNRQTPSSSNTDGLTPQQAVWRKAMDEAKSEQG